ncbi:DUF664 domain-containing protein [Streptomyces sp. NPDC008139]|uniref:DinB family protein n=1 Tax=Streptomyces sp. NPDC008139 TaxID=3364814 RepID=UPI0036EBA7C4
MQDTSSPDPETTMLLSYLDAQRRHVLGILEGLDEEALHRPVLPSGWSCAGLVRHLALDVERFWFRGVVAGEKAVIDAALTGPDDAWKVGPEVSAKGVLDLYRQETALADAVITSTAPSAAPAWWPTELFGPDGGVRDLREAILHVTVETACHAGHLDAVRELIDGRKWLVLTES